MSFLDKLERRFGFIAVPGLLRYVAMLTAMVFVIYKFDPTYLGLIDLDPNAIWRGQVWRLVTYIFVPQVGGLFGFGDWITAAFYVLLLWWIGNGLEEVWGAFRLSLFYFVGMIGTTIAALLFGASFSNAMLTSTLFFAFAHFFPDTVILFAFILPMKVKWIAWIIAGFLLLKFFVSSLEYQAAFVAAMANYVLFFGPEIYQTARHRREVSERRRRFDTSSREAQGEPLHKCAVCGATELSDADLEFRVARDGEEYCLAHLPKPVGAGI